MEKTRLPDCRTAECGTSRPSQCERRHEAILDAAETLFIEQGYDRTSLAEIVKLSGGSLATLYDLFGNKRGLLYAIVARWRDEAIQEPDVSGASGSAADVLMNYAYHKCRRLNSPHAIALLRILVSECLRDRDFALQTYRKMHLPAVRELSDMFAEWTAAGKAEIDDTEAAAELFLSLIAGDSMLNLLVGVRDGVLDETQIAWRLRPFLTHFRIC
jgi:AcrR family transcriptional regulator